MTARLPRSGHCRICQLIIIEGKQGWREPLGVPKALSDLYRCNASGSHEGPVND